MALPYQSAGLASAPASRITAVNKEILDARAYDQIFGSGTPALKTFMSRLEAKSGYNVEYLVRVGDIAGAARARDGQIEAYAAQTGAPATRAILNKYYYDWVLNLADVDIAENKGAAQLVAYMATQLDILSDSVKEDMAAWIWKPQTGNYMYSIHDAIGDTDDSADYAGITTATDLEQWSSFVMDANSSTAADTGVSPSLQNHELMLRVMFDYNGKYPSAIYTTGAVWDKLANEIEDNDYIAGRRGPNDNISWGVSQLEILGVPVLRDRFITSRGQTTLSDFSESTSRSAALGHCSYFVDWEYMHPYYTPGHKFQLQDWSTLRGTGYDRQWNNISFQGGIITNRRRAHGLICNIDTTIADTAYAEGDVFWNNAKVAG